MFQNNLKIALRTLLRNKGFTLIHLAGLSVGLACCLLIGLYVQHELSFDRYHEKSHRLYRLVILDGSGNSNEEGIAKVNGPYGPAALANIPEVENACRFVFYGQALVGEGAKRSYETGGMYADPSALEMFSWKLLKGDPATALAEPNSLVLTRELADKYFPGKDPIGQSLTFDNQNKYKVTGVLENVPLNSHFTFRFLVSLNTYEHPFREDWVRWNQFYTYLQLSPGAGPQAVAARFKTELAKHAGEDYLAENVPALQPVASIHLHSKLLREMAVNSDMSYVYIFSAIALFILVIACLNFINLSTAKATRRSKEVGVRKVTGATRPQLVRQFIGETLLLCLLSVGLAVMLAEFALPKMNAFLGRELDLNLLENKTLALGLAGMVLLTVLLSGSYPAFFLSSFRPVEVLKSKLSGAGNAGLRKALVVFQFAISIFLIIGALVVNQQLEFIQNKNLGFNREQIINVPIQVRENLAKAESIKAELSKIPGVLKVSASANQPGGSDYGVPYQALGVPEDQQPEMRCLVIDADFLETYEMELAAGRGFSKDMPTDTSAYLINETAAKQLGWDDPLQHQMAMPAINRPAGPVIGVLKDFHFRSLHEPIAPLYVFYNPGWFAQFNIKLDAARLEATLAALEQKWADFEPQFPFKYTFFDESFESLHDAEERTAMLVRWFTGLAIFITCLGLFGLAAFTAETRTKEIGIRKVLGATTAGIVGLLSKDFLTLVILSLAIASPLAWYFSRQWLSDFAYHIEIQWWVFVVAGLVAVAVAFLTVSFQSVKAALADPVKSLRSE